MFVIYIFGLILTWHGNTIMWNDNTDKKLASRVFTIQTLNEDVENAPKWIPSAQKSLPLYNTKDDRHYMAEMSVGNPGTRLWFIIDSGSSDLIIFDFRHFNKNVSTSLSTSPSLFDCTNPYCNPNSTLIIDNEYVKFTSKWAKDFLSLSMEITGTSSITENQTAEIDFLLTSHFSSRFENHFFHTFVGSDGIIGVNHNSNSKRSYLNAQNLQDRLSPFAELLLPVHDSFPDFWFALDLFNPDKESRMDIGGINESYRHSLVWSKVEDKGIGYLFKMHEFTICGKNLLDNSGRKHLSALVDTGATCLGLPRDIFNHLMLWIPVECINHTECYLPEGISPKLPTLTFKISPHGKKLYIPLEKLLLQNNDRSNSDPTYNNSRQRLCIRISHPLFGLGDFISLGNHVLRSLYTVFAGSDSKIGMANKITNRPSTAQCSKESKCKGTSVLDPIANTCINPNCGRYWIIVFNPVTKNCEVGGTFYTIILIMLVIFIATEICLSQMQKGLLATVYQTVNVS